jgi:hypothetical protein
MDKAWAWAKEEPVRRNEVLKGHRLPDNDNKGPSIADSPSTQPYVDTNGGVVTFEGFLLEKSHVIV